MEVNKPLVSACIITYNHEKFIRECLEGAINQKLSYPYEIVIGEDCSTDKTKQICKEYKKRYSDLIRLIERDDNIGMNGNWAETIKACNGKYIALCEGDDYWIDPKKLQKQVDFLEQNKEYAACYHKTMVVNERGKLIKSSKWTNYNTHTKEDLLYSKGEMITNTILFRNKLDLSDIGTVVNADTFLFHKIGEIGGGKFINDIEPSCYRVHSGGIWSLKESRFKLKSSIKTYESILISLKTNGYTKKVYEIYNKNARLVSDFMINELRRRSFKGYIYGLRVLIDMPSVKMKPFIKVHFKSVIKILIRKFKL